MAHYAKVVDGIVEEVIKADADFIATLTDSDKWIESFRDESKRKNHACIGFTYDSTRDAFIPPQPPYASWSLDESTCRWEPPTPHPTDDKVYHRNEETKSWDEQIY